MAATYGHGPKQVSTEEELWRKGHPEQLLKLATLTSVILMDIVIAVPKERKRNENGSN